MRNISVKTLASDGNFFAFMADLVGVKALLARAVAVLVPDAVLAAAAVFDS